MIRAPFIDENAIIAIARKAAVEAQRDAQDAVATGDEERARRRLQDAAFYASLLAQYDPEFWEGVAA